MDFTISEEILKIAFPALCGIGGVVVRAVLKLEIGKQES